MNKKFLSAILFGALMVTSTGTFVSCKDYDDDIDAINSELTNIKSTIAALQSKVDAGNYVTGVTKTAEGITFTFSNGTPVLVELQGGAAGKDGSIVTVEDGFLCIDGEATEISTSAVKIENGMWVALQADGTYASTGIPASGINVSGSEATGYIVTVYNEAGEATEIKLPTASSTLESIEVLQNVFNAIDKPDSEYGISWGAPSAKVDWAGPLGTIAKGQLLVGTMTNASLSVRPVAYDLSAQELTLVDNQGNVAPVEVEAIPASSEWITTGSRAASKTGAWNLAIKFTADVTTDNVKTAFTAKVGSSNYNKKYALAINGTIASDYEFVVKTATAAQGDFNFMADRLNINNEVYSSTKAYAVEKAYTVKYAGERNLADAYLTLSEAQKVKAELLGVTIDGMTINVPKSAANGAVTFTIKMLAVNGKVISQDFTMNFGTSKVDSEAMAATTYTLTGIEAKQYVDINVSEIFKSLTAAEIDVLDGDIELTVAPEQGENVFLKDVYAKYYPVKDGKINTAAEITLADKDVNAKTIAYVRVSTAEEHVNPKAKVGTYNLTMILKNVNGNELKKVTIPVTFELPAFSSLYAKSASSEWDGTTFNTTLMDGKKISLKNAFNAAEGYNLDDIKVYHAKVNDAMGEATYNGVEFAINANVVKDGALITTSLAAQASYTFYGYEYLVAKSDAFTIGLHSQFEAPKLVYYVNGTAKDVATVGENNEISLLTIDEDGKKQGLAIQYGKGEQAFFIGAKVDGVAIAATAAENQVKTEASIKDVANSKVTLAENVDGKVVVSENKGTLVVKFTDVNGVATTASIAFE